MARRYPRRAHATSRHRRRPSSSATRRARMEEATMTERKASRSQGVSRRRFLTGLGIGLGGAGVAGVATGVSLGRTDLRDRTIVPGNFSRLFPDLRPFYADLRVPGPTAQLQEALRDIGKPGG